MNATFYDFCATRECFLLTVMACERYVAICKSLLYPVVKINRLCSHLSVFSYVLGFLHSIIRVALLFRLTFCHSTKSIIFCDIILLYKISCTDLSINILVIFIFSGSIQAFAILTIPSSYICILFAILKKKSKKGRRKAFSTCGAHQFSVSLFFGSLLFMYVSPQSIQANDQHMVDSLFYMILKSPRSALGRALHQKCFCPGKHSHTVEVPWEDPCRGSVSALANAPLSRSAAALGLVAEQRKCHCPGQNLAVWISGCPGKSPAPEVFLPWEVQLLGESFIAPGRTLLLYIFVTAPPLPSAQICGGPGQSFLL
ncbi:LOW QUALITY PROTEIN: olfactory receptor 5H19-like [Sarcophilus harrisii]